MPKGNELSLEKRVQIQLLHEQGKSQVEISKTVKCSRRSVQYAIQRFSATGSHDNRPRTGRKRITTDREDRQLLRESLRNRKKTSSELAAELSEHIMKPISARTTRRRLQEAGLQENNKKARYEWALKHRTFTAEDWANVVWSDESHFEENSSLKSNNDGSSIRSHDTKSAVTLHVEGYSKSINDGCNMKSRDSRSAILPIIAKVFIFLEREYEYMKTLNGDNCDLSPLADILKRTAEATGFDEVDVIMVMEREKLADHLPDRARRKRKKSCNYLCELWRSEDEEVSDRDNLDVTVEKETKSHAETSSEDDEMLERDNLNVTVEKETTDNARYGHEALSSAPTYVSLTSDTEQAQVKVEPEDNEDVTSHEITPLESNSAPTYVSLTSDTEQAQVKVEPEDNEDVTSHSVLHDIPPLGSNDGYFKQDEDDKMDIEQYTFTGTRPDVPPNPTASVSEHADIKIEPADDH